MELKLAISVCFPKVRSLHPIDRQLTFEPARSDRTLSAAKLSEYSQTDINRSCSLRILVKSGIVRVEGTASSI
jgi:hypothetical protein